jgi:hypothetical protein
MRRSDRHFHITMGAVFGGLVLIMVALGWAAVATEPQRRAAYMTRCQEKGSTQEQCRFLYAELQRQDADGAVAISLSAAALAAAASRR